MIIHCYADHDELYGYVPVLVGEKLTLFYVYSLITASLTSEDSSDDDNTPLAQLQAIPQTLGNCE